MANNRLGSSATGGNTVVMNNDGTISIGMATGNYVSFGSKRIYYFTTAITANTTTTTAPAGSIALTTNSTGRMSIFVSDATKWQYLTNA
jgi:hypothetical protein